jgi:hypothetical protein
MGNTAERNRQRVLDAQYRACFVDANLASDLPGMQSEAMTVLCAVIQAGSLGGYASYCEACKAVGLQPLIPADTRDMIPAYRMQRTYTRDTSGNWQEVYILDAPDVQNADVEYLSYLASDQDYDLISQRGNALQAPAMGTFFARLLSEVMLGATVGDHAYPLLRDKTAVMRDTPPKGKGGGQAGMFTRYVLLSIQYVAWQCAGGIWVGRDGQPRTSAGRFDDTASYGNSLSLSDTGTLAVRHGWRHYYLQIEQAQDEEEKIARYWRTLREVEYIAPDTMRALERTMMREYRARLGVPSTSAYWRGKRSARARGGKTR